MEDYQLLHQSQEFYSQFFATNRLLSYDDYERYNIVFELIDSLHLSSSAAVLDIGGGAGRIPKFLAERFNNVTSIDITATPLMKNILHDFPQIKFTTSALPHLPFPTHNFDLVVCSEVLEHIAPNLQPFSVFEIGRMVAPGGWAIISTPNPHSVFETVRKVGALIKRRSIQRVGQLMENYIAPKTLCGMLQAEFVIKQRLGSFYLFPPLHALIFQFPFLCKFSEGIHHKGWLRSRGLYQYYVLRRE